MFPPKKKPVIIWQVHEANVSGANIAMLDYCDSLAEHFLFHIILPHTGSMEKALSDKQISYSIIPQYNWIVQPQTYHLIRHVKFFIRTIKAVGAIKKLIAEKNAAAVFTNTIIPFVAARASYKCKIPHVWWIHEFGEEDFGFSIGRGVMGSPYTLMERWSKLIVANSTAIQSKYQQLLPNSHCVTCYQPINGAFDLKTNSEVVKKAKFLMFGQIAPSKGHLDVIEAMHRNKQLGKKMDGLYIVGPSNDADYLALLKRTIDAYVLHQWIQIENGYFDKEKVMPQFEALIVASKSEAFGRVVIEAGRAGLKVIANNNGGVPELLNNSNGVLYNNIDELSVILSGEVSLPVANFLMPYDEQKEIDKLLKTLTELI